MPIYGKKPKRGKTYEAHTEPTPYGMGDYNGTGIKAQIGRIRDTSSPGYIPVPAKKLKVPPRSVV
jgi:hypothetical protein